MDGEGGFGGDAAKSGRVVSDWRGRISKQKLAYRYKFPHDE
jgi:hypothetical protein